MDVKVVDVDTYIESFSGEVKKMLKELRLVIEEEVPAGYEEKISYGLPTIYFKENLIHFGAFKEHIGFFPGPSGVKAFKEQLKGYDLSKGTIRFPLSQPIPFDLVREIVRFRVKEVLDKGK